MGVLKSTLLICTLAGCWQPPSWKLSFKYISYRTYAMLLIFSLCTFSISQFMHIILNVDSSDEFTNSLYMLSTIFVAAYKQIHIWINRKNIMTIINILTKKPFASNESHEKIIQKRFEKMIWINTLRYLIIVMLAVTTVTLMSLFTNLMKRNLTYKTWIPFDYSSPVIFYIVYMHQLIAMATSGVVNIACDSLFCGFLLYICCQFEILEFRLTKIASDQYILRNCVLHHYHIFEYANTINNKFAKIIAIQFVASALVMCSNIYRIVVTLDETDYGTTVTMVVYTSAILMQIFLYCWFGNKVKLKSLHLADGIYNIKWRTLTISNKKALLLIMNRTKIPIEFKTVSLITMNLDSFIGLLKLSYSVFSMLNQIRQRDQ